jgi:putative salt-induced outer membrane protein
MRLPFCLAAALLTQAARAQVALPDTTTQKPASAGSTDIANEELAGAHREKRGKDATEAKLSGGGLFTGGNARLLAVTGVGKLRVRRANDQVQALAAANYGESGRPVSVETVENAQGKLRYDRFFLEDWTAFFSAGARRDRFQGLSLRLNLQPGIGYYVVNEVEQLLWVELGYDFTYDVRRDDALTVLDPAGKPITGPSGQPITVSKTQALHSGRTFVGYEKNLNEHVTFVTGIEYLESTKATDVFRINWDASLESKVSKALSVALTFQERYENRPLPGKVRMDTMTSASLVYSVH